MRWPNLKRIFMLTAGYTKIESRHKVVDRFEAIRRALGNRPLKTIFDVGANHGQSARKFLKQFPGATIHSFEPFPDAFEKLKESAAGNPLVMSYPIAVGDKSGTATFHVNRSHSNFH